MRLRSTDGGTRDAAPRTEGASLSIVHSNDGELSLLPEQAAAVKARQQETGRSFEDIAVELGYLPEAAFDARPRIAPLHADAAAGSGLDPLIVMVSNQDDPLVSVAREIRAVIASMEKRDGSPMRRVAMLSLQARAENSILTANLAAAFALSGQRTLLIDANFNAPVQHALFRRHAEPGVSELLQSKGAPMALVQPTTIANLELLAVGAADRITMELTDRSALALATEHLSENYAAVIVDAGEADQIGTSCAQGFDGSVILVQRGLTSLRDARRLVERIRTAGDAAIGMVIVD